MQNLAELGINKYFLFLLQ